MVQDLKSFQELSPVTLSMGMVLQKRLQGQNKVTAVWQDRKRPKQAHG